MKQVLTSASCEICHASVSNINNTVDEFRPLVYERTDVRLGLCSQIIYTCILQ